MGISSYVEQGDKSKFNGNGVVAIDKSINSLVNFLDKLLKCIHDTLDQLENYYQTYMSAVQTTEEWNISGKTSKEQKRIDSKYNHIKNQLEEFLICIVKDYAEFIQDAYEIRTLHEQYDFHINYLQKLSLDDKKLDELDSLIPKVEKMKKQIDKVVLQYNAEVTKLSYLKLNLRYRVIVYRSSFTGQSFSIPINVLIRNFKNLIQSNKLVVIADQIHASLLEQPLSNIQILSDEPELIYARTVNVDPLLVNITERESKQPFSTKPPTPESPLKEPPQSNLSREKYVKIGQPSEESTILKQVRKRKPHSSLKDVELSKQEQPQVKLYIKPVAEPSSVQIAEPESSKTVPPNDRDTVSMSVDLPLTPVRKRRVDLSTPEGAEPQSLGVEKSDVSEIKQKRRGSNDETTSIVESEIDVTNTEDIPEDTSSMPSLRDELLEAEKPSTSSISGSPIQPQPKTSILKQKFKQRLEHERKQSRRIQMQVKKSKSKKYVATKPVSELSAIKKQKIITQEFYEKTYNQLENKISNIEMYENEGIVDKNNELCKKYHEIQRVLNNRKKDLDKTKREIEEIRQSEMESEKEQENLKEKEKMIKKFTTIIVDNELKIRRIQYQVRKLDKQDYDIQLYKNILYDAQIYLCQRLLGQLNKKLALETDDEKKKELRIDIQKLKKRIENISFEIKDLHSSYMLRKRRRMISGPYKANFCIKHTLDAEIWGRKYGGAEYQPGLVNDPLAVREEEVVQKTIPSSAPTNILIPKRKPQ